MEISQIESNLKRNLEFHLKNSLPFHSISEVYHYAVFPPGKLFRPKLVWALALDIDAKLALNLNSPLSHLACAIEFHHAYTLIHDDLPCMDNDDFRRGKPSTHKAYGEVNALLVGDGLINLSYELLFKLPESLLPKIGCVFSKLVGPKGLILGQILDLQLKENFTFNELIQIQKLKTSRLIQASLICSYFLAESRPNFAKFFQLYRLGHHLGLLFQLFDDLSEFCDPSISEHEKDINAFAFYPKKAFEQLYKSAAQIRNTLGDSRYPHLLQVLQQYFTQMNSLFTKNKAFLDESKLGDTTQVLFPMMGTFDGFE